jgi:hypothetical protein
MSDIGHKYLHCFLIARHENRVLAFLHDKFQPPQPVRRWSKPSTNCWPLSVADESEIRREEEIIDFFRCITEPPKWEIGMVFYGRRCYLQVHRNPRFVVSKTDEKLVFKQAYPFCTTYEDICSISTPLGSRYDFLVNPVFPSHPTRNLERTLLCAPSASEY